MHVTQRGVNRCAMFIDDEGRHHFRHLTNKACGEAGVALHAFVRMDNPVHVLLGASESGAVSHVMRSAGQVCVNPAVTDAGAITGQQTLPADGRARIEPIGELPSERQAANFIA